MCDTNFHFITFFCFYSMFLFLYGLGHAVVIHKSPRPYVVRVKGEPNAHFQYISQIVLER